MGSHLVEHLVAHGCDVRCFVRYTSRNDKGLLGDLDKRVLDSVEIVAGDLRDPEAVRNAALGTHVIFHLGALIAIPYSYRNPGEVAETNVMGTLNVLQAARVCDIPRIVHTSTSEVYGTARMAPMPETHPLQAQSPYAASKIGADKLAESFHLSYGLPVTTIRPYNIFGPRQSERAVTPTIVNQALYRDVIRLGALSPTRDLTFVKDTVRAFRMLAECDEAVGGVFNVGTGTEVSIGDLATLVLELVGSNAPIVTDEERLRPETSEVFRLIADSSRAREVFGWTPDYTLRDGLLETIAWFREHPERYGGGKYLV